MRRFLPILPFFLLPLAAPGAAAQEAAKPEPPRHAFLWKVEREGLAASWLFGTIHVPDERVHALHPAVKAALEGADAYYGELAMDRMKELEGLMMEAGALEEGRDLEQILPAELWQRLDARLRAHGMTAAMLRRLRPFMVNLTLAQLEMLPLLAEGKKALDQRLYNVAKNKGKEVGGVEDVEEQIAVLTGTLTEEEDIAAMRKALDELDRADQRGIGPLERLLRGWLSGSERYLLALAMETWDMDDPVDRKFYEALLLKRNVVMAARAAAKMRAAPETSFIFAFGAFHFLGEGSVVELLRRDGFTVTRMNAPTAEEEQALLDGDPWLERAEAEAAAEPVGAGQ